MSRNDGRKSWCWSLAITLISTSVLAEDAEHVLDDSHKYISRPDLESPLWNITIFDREKISPGYWFLEPYDYLDQSTRTGGNWTAPMIFDDGGELIWSGAHLSQQYDSFDFKLSNVLGEDMLTWLYPRNRSLLVLDKQFNIRKRLQISSPEAELDNMHDLNFVNDGTRALFFYDYSRNATALQSEALGLQDRECSIRENSFREIDLKNQWRVDYDWSSSDHILLSESTFTEAPLEKRCLDTAKGWDWIHVNSLDKFEDGSFLMSGRHTNTLYRIKRSGNVDWRLGGEASDFEADFDFKRQHHARILSENATHTIISFFDNAGSEDKDKGLAKWSRSLVVALQTESPMTATLLGEYGHPDGPGHFTLGRGSTQVLSNGNVFSGWVNGLLQSEHSSDGKLLMMARVKQNWLKSYRSYKFPFEGRPSAPPDVKAAVNSKDGSVKTVVHVSWNGATEVARWELYKTTSEGKTQSGEPTVTVRTTGFETKLEMDVYATYVVLEGIDRHGKSLGKSKVTETIGSTDVPDEVLEDEKRWLEKISSLGTSWKETATSSNGVTSVIGSLAVLVGCIFAFRYWRRRGKRWTANSNDGQSYEMVDREESAFELDDDEEHDVMDKSSPQRIP